MKTSRFSENQIIGILKEVEAGAQVKETVRKYGIADKTYYKWKAAYAGMNVSELKRMRELEVENTRLKKMYAELSLVHHALQGIISKKL